MQLCAVMPAAALVALLVPQSSASPQQIRDITFEDVSFRYKENGEPVLDHVDLRIRKGEKIGILGPGGVGKSTILRLLL